jgi:SOS-response transcriptional repressor LexA
MFVSENIIEYVSLPYSKQSRCFALRVQGSPVNEIIADGDIILADMDAEINNTDIVVGRLKNGEQLIKHYFQFANGQVIFYSNPNYEPVVCNLLDIEAVYKVVGLWRSLVR